MVLLGINQVWAADNFCNTSEFRNYCEGLPEVPHNKAGLPTQGKFTWDETCANATVGSKCKATCDTSYVYNDGSFEVECVLLVAGAEPQWQLPSLYCAFNPLGVYANVCMIITTIVTFVIWTLIGMCMYRKRKSEHVAIIASGVPKRDE